MMSLLLPIAAISLAIWVYMLVARGGFWLAREGDGRGPSAVADGFAEGFAWPDVVAVIPARNEAASIGQTVDSLLRQDYAGRLRVIVIDDQSEDATADLARAAADAC